MGLGTRGSWALLFVGALLVLALLKVAVEGGDSAGSVSPVPPSNRNESSSSTMKPSTTSFFSVSVNTSKSTVKPSTTSVTLVTKNVTVTTLKPTTTSQVTTPPGVSTNTTSTTLKSTPKITSVSQNTSQVSTSSMATSHNSSVTSVSSSVTITATINSKENKGSKFDIGSFVGGIALTLGILSILYIGCKVYYSRRGIQYRTIDEHDAII
ncbi:porimin [Desmodus rotundus]|uniref:porimin n=1 Tax=Desmodus rotundus TaxID=9430 RepID=UPI00238131CF|nr:porimin [Desmodus rotundus]